jgi:hypothetical protein
MEFLLYFKKIFNQIFQHRSKFWIKKEIFTINVIFDIKDV